MRKSNSGSLPCKNPIEDTGVDLNRNYDFAFGHDNVGSNKDPCAEDYRGKSAFSEPATRQVRNFLTSTPSVKIALNLHAWGNLLVHPWSYLNYPIKAKAYSSSLNSKLGEYMCATGQAGRQEYFKKLGSTCQFLDQKLVDLDEAFKFYSFLIDNANLPSNNMEGNGYATVDYPANGEASDWMLGNLGIFAMSPELGSNKQQSEDFFIQDPDALFDVLQSNYDWIRFTILSVMPTFTLKVVSAVQSPSVVVSLVASQTKFKFTGSE